MRRNRSLILLVRPRTAGLHRSGSRERYDAEQMVGTGSAGPVEQPGNASRGPVLAAARGGSSYAGACPDQSQGSADAPSAAHRRAAHAPDGSPGAWAGPDPVGGTFTRVSGSGTGK